jgi:DNA (cytosine-5)-methyltransferase 1
MSETVKVLDLFSGIGGFSLGLERAGMKTIAFCEIEKYPQSILRKHWPNVPIFEDVREIHAKDLPEPVDVICGGFPCQPFSLAGKRQGKDDDRHLWPEFLRIIKECRPAYVICENVTGLVSMGLDTVLSDLEGEGYTGRPFIIPACAVNAPHRRDRVWIVAYATGNPGNAWRTKPERQQRQAGIANGGDVVADSSRLLLDRGGDIRETRGIEFTNSCYPATDANDEGPQRRSCLGAQEEKRDSPGRIGHDFAGSDFERLTRNEWTTEPPVCGRDDGIPKRMAGRVAKLKALGNSVVPQIPEIIGRAIIGLSI